MRLLLLAVTLCAALPARADVYVLTAAGLGGDADYEQRFTQLAADADRIFRNAGPGVHATTLSGKDATREELTQRLRELAMQVSAQDDFVLLLIGHGSFDGTQYKLNLPGPDITAAELAGLCDAVPAKRQLIVDTTSASGGAVRALRRPGRALITATKSGTEKNATVFARYWLEALQDPTADVDKNDAISALEAFRYATTKTAAFYESQKRLATEHAQFEDTGAGEPVRAATDAGEGRLLASFTLIRLGATPALAADPARRAWLTRKEQLEQQIDTLKYQRAAMSPEDYKRELTQALLELARVQAELDK
ncbi:MAG TPA: hypothetical protein VLW26_05855 [Steroidobacteraceae bacterium]|nr:hypothetical protein [Steroidobacteraceae bacterium]